MAEHDKMNDESTLLTCRLRNCMDRAIQRTMVKTGKSKSELVREGLKEMFDIYGVQYNETEELHY